MLLGPLSHLEFFIAFVAAAMLRAILVGLAIFLVADLFIGVTLVEPLFALLFGLLGAAILATVG